MKPRVSFALLSALLFAPNLMAEEEAPGEPAPPPSYSAMQPALVVNVADEERVRHMQVSIQLKLSDSGMEKYIRQYNPALRHELVMLLSDQPIKKLKSSQGKIDLQKDALAALRQVMKDNTRVPAIEAVYFTEMVIQ